MQITKNSGDDQTPEVYGDRVVWAGHDSNSIYQIYTWTPSGGTKKISSETSNPAYPVVSGDRISWCGDGTTVVKTWTAATGIVNVSELEDAGYKYDLKASGDRLVWTSDSGVFTWTPADGVVRITPDARGFPGFRRSGRVEYLVRTELPSVHLDAHRRNHSALRG